MAITLPPEAAYTDTELNWIDSEPPGLLPSDQSGLWGQARKVFADYLQREIVDKLDSIYNSLDPATADAIGITRWEMMLGIPVNPTKSLEQRRAFVQSRRERGPFTHERRRKIVEAFITSTFGLAPAFGIGGIPLLPGGIPLYSGLSSLVGTYAIAENIPGFGYAVFILDGVAVDEDGLTRELDRITPQPIAFTLESGVDSLYYEVVLYDVPEAYWRLNATGTDETGHGHTLAATVPPVATTALILNDADAAARDFNGTTQFYTIPTFLSATEPALSLEAWVNFDVLPSNPNYMFLITNPAVPTYLAVDSAGNLFTSMWVGGVQKVTGVAQIVPGQTYHVVGTCDGKVLCLYVNGTLMSSVAAVGTIHLASTIYLGQSGAAAHFLNGKMDEVAIYKKALTAEQVRLHYLIGTGAGYSI